MITSQTQEFDRYNNVKVDRDLSAEALALTFVNAMDLDSIRKALSCMRHKATPVEESYIDANFESNDSIELRKFVYGFWSERNAIQPEDAYRNFERDMKFVEEYFSLKNRHGCGTDRGRVYMFYGKPNTRVMQVSEPNASDYEIWHYYQTPRKRDAKFAFVDRTQITNDYTLLHSNVPGEILDYQWYLRLNNSITAPLGSQDDFNARGDVINPENMNGVGLDEVGSRALDFWNNPR